MSKMKIQRVSPGQLREMLSGHTPRGLFLARDGYRWVAVDNSTCDEWTEEFSRKRQAVRWLHGEFEVGDRAKPWTWISDAQELVAVALQQGIVLDTEEADVILGYLEGHEYSLMTDGQGATVRHDDQYGNNHRGDEPYTVQDAIEFCQEMNEDLLNDSRSQDEEYLSQLRKDGQILDTLLERVYGNL